MNLSTQTAWGAEQFSANVIENPGFEPTLDRAIVIVSEASAQGFADNAAWLGRADGFWDGGSYQVLTGQSAGHSGTIASSVHAGPSGMPWFTTRSAAPPLKAGDVIAVTREQTDGPPALWWVDRGTKARLNFHDRCPGSPGHTSVEIAIKDTAAELDSYVDAGHESGGKVNFLPINGGLWRLSFWMRATVPGTRLTVSFARLNGTVPFVRVERTPTTSWEQVQLEFTPEDSGPPGPLDLRFTVTGPAGGAVRLDDVVLGNRAALTAGPWRPELVSTLRVLRPGYLRDWQGQLGDTIANRLAPAEARQPSRWYPDPDNTHQNYLYSIPDFLALCDTIGAIPWIVVPTTFYADEYTTLGRYLRRAEAHYHFKEIVAEFGDENWNSVFRAAGIPDPAIMGEAANRGFLRLRAAAGDTVPLHLEVNSQYVNPWTGEQALRHAPAADGADVAPYFFYTFNTGDSPATVLKNLFTMSDEGPLLERLKTAVGPHKSVDIYEVNLSTVEGSAPAAERNPYVAGRVAGSALAARLLTGLAAGVRRQAVFDLAEYAYRAPNVAGGILLWGINHRLEDRGAGLRPTGLALEMVNRATVGDFYPATVSDASGVTAAAFRGPNGWSLAVVSANPAPLAIRLEPLVGAAPPTQVLTLSAAPTLNATQALTASNDVTVDNPQGASQVMIVERRLNGDTFTVPPYGFVVLLPNQR